ncbi:hypothetical protein HDU83_000103 [Entophlyctis luteolus]|nr:hypothetical protein HDU83_000103 [Entophlyctis luteolus]KAJ3395320.1 hypothetical protein HDU84_000087 [Entophlyctis sp. JEL0112]
MADKYWDIDDALAEQQRIPCFVALDIPGYGFLDGNQSEKLLKNTRVEIPYWLVVPLTVNDSVELEYPACFSKRVLDDLESQATAVNLNGLCSCFFEFGIKFVNLIDDSVLGKALADAFAARLMEIMLRSQSGRTHGKFVAYLDDTEKKIFAIGRESVRSMQEWASSKSTGERVQTARVLQRAAGAAPVL